MCHLKQIDLLELRRSSCDVSTADLSLPRGSDASDWLEAWDKEYEKKRIIRRDKFWDEFFVKHFGEDYVGRDPSLVNSSSGS